MIKLIAVIERDLKKFRRNPVVLAMSILMPLIYLVIIGNSFQGKLKALPVVLVNQDSGPSSQRIIENLYAVAGGPGTINIINMKDHQDAIDGVRSGRYKAAVIIPADFSRMVTRSSRPSVGLFLDNTDGVSSETIRNTVEAAVRASGAEYVPIRERPGDVRVRDVNLYSKVDYYQSLVPGVVIMAIFLGTLTTGAFNLVMDRFLGIDESYLLTPISKAHIVAGLTVSGLFITVIIASFILTVSMLITDIPFSRELEHVASIFTVITLTTLCLLSMMFVIIGRVNHPRIVGILSGFLNVILFFPSGAIYPIASFPPWLKAFAKVNPEAYAVDALKSILFKGAGIVAVWHDIAYLVLFTVVMMSIAIAAFKRTI